MDWGTAASTLLGAGIGLGATFVADTARARRGRRERWAEQRRQLYADYLAALARVADDLHAIARHPDRADLVVRASDAWRASPAYGLRYQMTLDAPAGLCDLSDDCFRRLRDLRGIVARGAPTRSPELVTAATAYDESLAALRTAMRADLAAERS
ncbi:hypothetical protein ACIQBJ_32800 [Kitasatospora sp. NPDC088391]|uniref:hypothetical protein n=1 Tax=Kitasatospora sp. NPDC088391 TaxID=3364074 RepID=UPI00382D26E1